MTAPATPVASPVSGQVALGTDVTIDAVEGVTFYYTLDGSTPNYTSAEYADGDLDGFLEASGDNLNVNVIAYNDSDTSHSEPSAVLTAQYSAVGYGAAVGANTPAIVDTEGVQTGASILGIGKTGSDGASVGGARIGGSPGTYFKYETNV